MSGLRDDVAAIRAAAEATAAHAEATKNATLALMADSAIQTEHQRKLDWWMQFATWWLISLLGYALWSDFHLGGKFHLGERRGD